ncbi:PulJ/GspJ family protein [Pseudohaliea rubra]|uniref:General secretion pathway protein J n=1 Tax=Pseudohaliea rubra DSM 19751 TaxID=1265313 RepID=A0A095VUJ4_9GAMM|nr:prepilin-type N-terminal cleavage/methylation domain-containing protein [Pseudohaliea rubra]KGE04743.1 General secretion pathway protein J [Pseudohaliea rubra DSM 19751]
MIRRGRGCGFTLVEVVVSLAVLSLIMLATVTGLRTLGNTQVAVDRQVDRVSEVRAVSSFLRDSFSAAVTGSGSGGLSLGGGMSETTVFELTGQGALIWKAVVLFGESYGGNYLVRLGKQGDELVLRWRASDGTSPLLGWNKAPERTLVSGLDSFEVAYRRTPGGPWLSAWDRAGPPGWVRLRLKVDGRFWPDLVMVVAR